METIQCEICTNQRPQNEIIPVFFDDEFHTVCTHCVEAERIENELDDSVYSMIDRW